MPVGSARATSSANSEAILKEWKKSERCLTDLALWYRSPIKIEYS